MRLGGHLLSSIGTEYVVVMEMVDWMDVSYSMRDTRKWYRSDVRETHYRFMGSLPHCIKKGQKSSNQMEKCI